MQTQFLRTWGSFVYLLTIKTLLFTIKHLGVVRGWFIMFTIPVNQYLFFKYLCFKNYISSNYSCIILNKRKYEIENRFQFTWLWRGCGLSGRGWVGVVRPLLLRTKGIEGRRRKYKRNEVKWELRKGKTDWWGGRD